MKRKKEVFRCPDSYWCKAHCVGAGGVQNRYFVLVQVAVRVYFHNEIWLHRAESGRPKIKGTCNQRDWDLQVPISMMSWLPDRYKLRG